MWYIRGALEYFPCRFSIPNECSSPLKIFFYFSFFKSVMKWHFGEGKSCAHFAGVPLPTAAGAKTHLHFSALQFTLSPPTPLKKQRLSWWAMGQHYKQLNNAPTRGGGGSTKGGEVLAMGKIESFLVGNLPPSCHHPCPKNGASRNQGGKILHLETPLV